MFAHLAQLVELCSNRADWRYLSTAFGGCGLFSLSTECVIARLNLLLQYWLAPSTYDKSLSCSMEYLQLEAGFASCIPNASVVFFSAGLCIVLAITLFYEISSQNLALVACDNKGALFKAKVFCKRIPPGAKQYTTLPPSNFA